MGGSRQMRSIGLDRQRADTVIAVRRRQRSKRTWVLNLDLSLVLIPLSTYRRCYQI